jgi:hypothetical protein
MGEGRVHRLCERAFHNREAVCSNAFSMRNHGLVSSTGWQGHAPPKKMQEELKELYWSGQICEYLGVFFPIPYSMPPQ